MAAVTTTTTFLADHVSKAKRLSRFRDTCFPLLRIIDADDRATNSGLRRINRQDLEQIIGLFRKEAVRSWLQSDCSSLLLVNTPMRSRMPDWATAFATRIIEHAGSLRNMTVLHHFCGAHDTVSPVSSAKVVIQAMIMQLVQQRHKSITRKVFPFTMEHFQDAGDDLEDLWNIFIDCCTETCAPCIWLIIDNIDNLQHGTDLDTFVNELQKLTDRDQDSRIFKILILNRGPDGILHLPKSDPIKSVENANCSPRLFTATVPRTPSRTSAAILSKLKRPARLEDPSTEQITTSGDEKAALTHEEAEDLLRSSGDELGFSDDERSTPQHTQSSALSLAKASTASVDSSEFSDSSLEFTKDDPFASSDENEWEKKPRTGTQDTLSDSDDDYLESSISPGLHVVSPTRGLSAKGLGSSIALKHGSSNLPYGLFEYSSGSEL